MSKLGRLLRWLDRETVALLLLAAIVLAADNTEVVYALRIAVFGFVAVNVLPHEKRLRVLAALANGSSIRGAEQITGVNRDTIVRFLRMFGERCTWLHNARVRELACANIQIDEQHSFVLVKQGHLAPEHPSEAGDTWSWSAIDRKTRLVLAYYVGKRNEQSATAFLTDLRARLVRMPQISSDGLALYAPIIERLFGPGVAYATIIKAWDRSRNRRRGREGAPPAGPLLVKTAILGEPDLDMATTAHNERINLTMRQTNARLHRRTLAFSKRFVSHEAAVAAHYVAYNFCHVLRTTKTTPAVCAGIAERPWTLVELLDAALSAEPCESPEPKPLRVHVPDESRTRRGPPAPRKLMAEVRAPAGQLELFSWRPGSRIP